MPGKDIYHEMLKCTHGLGQPSKTKDGIYRKSTFRDTGCKAQISATLKIRKGEFRVCITKQKTIHNHPVNEEQYKFYHEQRILNKNDQGCYNDVQLMVSSGANKRKILQYIRKETGKEMTMVDLHNFIAHCNQGTHEKMTENASLQAVSRIVIYCIYI